MKRTHFYVALVSVIALVGVGCRTNPVYNVDGAPVVTNSTGGVSIDAVGKAIIRAGTSLGWQMKQLGSNDIVGTLALRKHVAVVDIKYDSRTYSIKYRDSQNLDYDGTSIHQNYNGWVKNLDRAIRTQLTAL